MSEFNLNSASTVPMSAGSWLGGWVFNPGYFGAAGNHRDAYLERDGERVPLVHCSADLREFTELMARIEAKFSHHYAAQVEAGWQQDS